MSPPTTLAKALALIEAHRKVTPEPPGVRYVAVTFECDDDAPRAYIRSVINDAPVVALALIEAEELARTIAAETYTQECCGQPRWDGDPRHEPQCCGSPTDGLSRSQEAARDWLAKHGGA